MLVLIYTSECVVQNTNNMHKKLRLHHHKHTGKLLHHKHTSYHALLLVLAIAGVFMVSFNRMAQAADFEVSAIVPAPLPNDPAVITTPADGSVVTTSSVTVGGTCPVITPAIIVVLYESSTFMGSDTCSVDGTFAVPTTFSPGSHTLTATVMNFTGQSGATSTPVTFTYTPPPAPTLPTPNAPTPPVGGATPTPKPNPSPVSVPTSPLEIVSERPFILFGRNRDAVWHGTVQGGTTPYTLTVSWGDGETQKLQGLSSEKLSLSHRYQKSGIYQITLQLTDASGQTVTRSLVALSPYAFSLYQNTPSLFGGLGGGTVLFPWVLYWLYGLLVLLLLWLWQRERLRHVHTLVFVSAKQHKPIRKRR
jgi:hypothetical protein